MAHARYEFRLHGLQSQIRMPQIHGEEYPRYGNDRREQYQVLVFLALELAEPRNESPVELMRTAHCRRGRLLRCTLRHCRGIEKGQRETSFAHRPVGFIAVVDNDLSCLIKNGPRNDRCFLAAADVLDLAYQFRKIETAGPVEVHRESDNGNGFLVRSCAVVFPGNDLVGDLAYGHVIEGEATARLHRFSRKTGETIRNLGAGDNRYGISLGRCVLRRPRRKPIRPIEQGCPRRFCSSSFPDKKRFGIRKSRKNLADRVGNVVGRVQQQIVLLQRLQGLLSALHVFCKGSNYERRQFIRSSLRGSHGVPLPFLAGLISEPCEEHDNTREHNAWKQYS